MFCGKTAHRQGKLDCQPWLEQHLLQGSLDQLYLRQGKQRVLFCRKP